MTAMPHLPLMAVGLPRPAAGHVAAGRERRQRRRRPTTSTTRPASACARSPSGTSGDAHRRSASISAASRSTASTTQRHDASRSSARRCTSWTTSSASRWSRPARRGATAHAPTQLIALPVRQSPRLGEPGAGRSRRRSSPTRSTYPYGSTSYQAGRSVAEVSLKRYRYTGKERDEETGLNYHGARYYAPWLGRWTSCDPSASGRSESLRLLPGQSHHPRRSHGA